MNDGIGYFPVYYYTDSYHLDDYWVDPRHSVKQFESHIIMTMDKVSEIVGD